MSKIQIEGLLKDAAFLADKDKGIPHFCIEPENRGDFWKNLSKYTATKPINQAFNAMMTNRSFDEVTERFLRNLSVKIPKEESGNLEKFVAEARKVLKKYHELRKANVSEFIKAKNSLLSAIFVLTRYHELKEVCNE
ncbi:MAG: hypothetical protein U9R01_03065 [candidate division WOR-3 bacterium]|nr:hypothetical protein [candidate division WOR-3 bacterium]